MSCIATTTTTPSDLFDEVFDWQAWAAQSPSTPDQEIGVNVPLTPDAPLALPLESFCDPFPDFSADASTTSVGTQSKLYYEQLDAPCPIDIATFPNLDLFDPSVTDTDPAQLVAPAPAEPSTIYDFGFAQDGAEASSSWYPDTLPLTPAASEQSFVGSPEFLFPQTSAPQIDYLPCTPVASPASSASSPASTTGALDESEFDWGCLTPPRRQRKSQKQRTPFNPYPSPPTTPTKPRLTSSSISSSKMVTMNHALKQRPQSHNPNLITPSRTLQVSLPPSARTPTLPRDATSCPVCSEHFLHTRWPDMNRHFRGHFKRAMEPWVCCGLPVAVAAVEGVYLDDIAMGKTREYGGVQMVGGCGRVFSRRDAYGRHLAGKHSMCVGYTHGPWHRGNQKMSGAAVVVGSDVDWC